MFYGRVFLDLEHVYWKWVADPIQRLSRKLLIVIQTQIMYRVRGIVFVIETNKNLGFITINVTKEKS